MANLDLSKLFVSVPQDKVEGFLKKYYTGTPAVNYTQEEIDAASEGDAAYGKTTADVKTAAVARLEGYDKKVVFLGTSGQIFTQGKLYGGSASEITGLVDAVAKLNGADTLEGSVAYAVKAAKTAVLGSANSTNTVDSVAGRVTALETLVGDGAADADTVINKLQEVYNWFAEVAETETGKALIESVATNTSAIGTKGIPAVEGKIWVEGSLYKKVGEEYVEVTDASTLVAGETYYTDEGDDNNPDYQPVPTSRIAPATANIIGNGEDADTGDWYDYRLPVTGKDSTGLYKYVDDAVEAANSSTDEAIKALDVTGNVSDEVAGIKVQVDEVDGKVQKPVVTVTGGSVAEGNASVVTGGTVHSAIKTAIEGLDVEETEVKSPAENPVVSFKYKEEDGKVSISNLEIVTKDLSTVGLVKATEGENAGKWVAGSASDDKGLATAADVAAEIVADEEVIAAALNDHEARIKANEDAIGKKAEGENAATGLYKEIADAKAAASAAHNEVAKKSTGHVTVTASTDTSTGKTTYTIGENDIQSAATYKTDVTDKLLGAATVSGSVAEAKKAGDDAQTAVDNLKGTAATGDTNTLTVAAVSARVKAIEDMDLWETYTEA